MAETGKMANVEELGYDAAVTTYEVAQKLNLREEPSKNAEIIRVLPVGEKIEVIFEDGEWVATKEGFCMKKFLK